MEKNLPQVTELHLPGVLLITPQLYADERGFFSELYNEDVFASIGITTQFVQDSTSYSVKNVIRGMHYQLIPHEQAKLVRCAHGKIFDVAADVDPVSPTYGRYVGVELSGETGQMLYIPGTYAHGFAVLSEDAHVAYKLSALHNPSQSRGVRYNDPVINIVWPITDPILSEKDRLWEDLPHI